MDDYVEIIINESSTKIINSNKALTPSGNNIFEKDKIKILGKKRN